MWKVYFSLVEIRNLHIMLYMLQVPRSKHLCSSIVLNPIIAGLLLLGMVMYTNSNHPTQTLGNPAWVSCNSAKGPRNHGPLWCNLMSRFFLSFLNGLRDKSGSYVFESNILKYNILYFMIWGVRHISLGQQRKRAPFH